MKGVKDEEKMMSPMFPRLHVSDTEKGGPRAPPRNKMALYEQLSIPSQRHNSGAASKLPAACNNADPLVSTASLSQGVGHERTAFPPLYIPPTPADSEGNDHSHSSDGMFSRMEVDKSEPKSVQLMNYKKSNVSVLLSSNAECGFFLTPNSKNSCLNNPGNDNDFSVPTFVNPGITSSPNKDRRHEERERLTRLSPNHPSRSTETSGNSTQKAASATCNSIAHLHSAQDKHLKRTNTTDLWSRQHVRIHCGENHLESITNKGRADSTVSPFPHEQIAEPSKHSDESPNQERQSSSFDDLGGSRHKDNDGQLQLEYRAGFLTKNVADSNGIVAEPVALMGKGNTLKNRSEFPSRDSLGNNRGSRNENHEDQIHGFVQVTDLERNDDASETSMVDSISGFDISPDDVVGLIGQKHFWKARRAIVNQQRLFAVQVFELHRLIKVQKLIAGSPHLLLEDTAYIKPALKASPPKKQHEYLLKSAPQVVKQRVSQKPNQSDCAAENAVTKLPLPSMSEDVNKEHANQHSTHRNPPPPPPPPPPVSDGNKTGWSYQPPPGNQWLVPVMSPSEGLVYKPYTGPCPPAAGFMAPLYGSCGHMSTEYPSPYGTPAPQLQGMGVYSNTPPFPQPYFSPYGMQMMNPVISASSVEHVKTPFTGRGQISTGETNLNTRSRTSRNQRSEANSSGLPKLKESEIQGSTASSPGEKAGNVSQGRGDALQLFPMISAVQGGGPDECTEVQNGDQKHTRVIKVVPHNPRSATESAARIFQSIQEERQQYE